MNNVGWKGGMVEEWKARRYARPRTLACTSVGFRRRERAVRRASSSELEARRPVLSAIRPDAHARHERRPTPHTNGLPLHFPCLSPSKSRTVLGHDTLCACGCLPKSGTVLSVSLATAHPSSPRLPPLRCALRRARRRTS